MTNIRQRLAKLEAVDGGRFGRFAWVDYGEDTIQAHARWCVEHPDLDPATPLTFIGWEPPGQAG